MLKQCKTAKIRHKKGYRCISEVDFKAIKAGIQANYVLLDSWLSSLKAVRSIKGLDVVAMAKKGAISTTAFRGICARVRILSATTNTDAATPGVLRVCQWRFVAPNRFCEIVNHNLLAKSKFYQTV